MRQRNMICTSQIVDLAMDHRGQAYPHPEPCIHLGGVTNFRQLEIQPVVTASGNTTILDAHHVPERYDRAIFYGMPQYHGVQHHPCPHPHGPNLDLGVATGSHCYPPYMIPSSGISVSHGSHDQLPSSSNYGVIGVSADEFGSNGHFMDNAIGSYKSKNAEGNPLHSQYFNSFASSSSSVAPLNGRNPDAVPLSDAASFTLPWSRGNSAPSVREGGAQRSARNRLGITGLDPILAHNQNHFLQGNYVGQPFQPGGSVWLDQHLSNSSSDAGASVWTQAPTISYVHGNNVNGGSIETGNMGPQQYHEPASNLSNTNFLHTYPINPRHQNFHHLPPPIQGIRGHSINLLPQVPSSSFGVPTTYASPSTMRPSQDGLDIGFRHPGSVQPTGLRIYGPHFEGIPEPTLRHRNVPHLRVVPTDGVAVLEFPDYYEVGNYTDHHREMRLDIEDMSYEELLALEERIGNVNTGLSEETIRSQLKTRTYLSSPTSINLEEPACMDQEPDSCIICQDDYKSQEKIGALDCGHDYHADCLKKWLCVKNVCPICKSVALSTERKTV